MVRGNRIEVSNRPKIVQVVSKRWICSRCGLFCMELVPVLKRGMGVKALKVHKIFCRNLCHEKEDWKFHEFKGLYRL